MFAFLVTASSSFAYSYYGVRWSANSKTYYIHSGVYGLWGTQIKSADASWDASGSKFRFNYGSTTARNASLAYGSTDTYSDVGYRPLGKTGEIGKTYLNYSGSYLNEVDAIFNTDYSFSTSGESCCYDAQSMMTHEFGHWLVLDHSSSWCGWSFEATMCSSMGTGETRKRSLETDDKDGIKSIYGT